MLWVALLLIGMGVLYVLGEGMLKKKSEEKGVCRTTGGSCTSPTGCTCDTGIEK